MRAFANHVGILYLGRLIETGPTRALFERPAHPYTRSLLAAVPVVSDEEEALKPREPVAEGEVPNPANMPGGCVFHTRCPHVMAICRSQIPGPEQVGPEHVAHCHLLRPLEAQAAPFAQMPQESRG
ncbi:oligopeptide/dipeptide ABC transporter ATP-binding protein [Roseiarcus fermentans]|uniref:Oligopeptide/dipeptide ABC transporter ATP-binding protein n=1 Tax=Roseiarcus fermentans TaxID=1473586 RepID=A0A366F826_9HYPH|nr:ABC transporter ATP-binding protein [Roseiarcus fermentans]RBP09919.1 oligopeptide/dipeptide ABC transporter ATP-binding protein [Roseiarcus fermentans]